ncbi:MAG: RES family NAD+ phosphorylase [Dongiaceae bacterium]
MTPSAADDASSVPPLARVSWRPSWRIVPSRFPPIAIFERVVDPADLDAVIAIESLTNERLRDEIGEIGLVPPDDRISGPGSSAIMAAFTHPNPEGSRFSDGSYGVYYAAHDIDTAIAETRYHRERFMRATREARMELDMRVYVADLGGKLHDLRGRQSDYPQVYDPDDYSAGRALGMRLHKTGSRGIAYDSVRHDGGLCAAVFRPRLLSNCRQERHLCYVWNGARIETVYEKREFAG